MPLLGRLRALLLSSVELAAAFFLDLELGAILEVG